MNFKNKLDLVLNILPITYRGLPDIQVKNIDKELNLLGADKTNVLQYLIDKRFVSSEVINRPNVLSGTVWIKTNLSLRFAQENISFTAHARNQRKVMIIKAAKNWGGVLGAILALYFLVKYILESF